MKNRLMILSLMIACLILSIGCVSAKPSLIAFCWGPNSYPEAFVQNKDFADTLPLDGMAMNSIAGRFLMSVKDFSRGNRSLALDPKRVGIKDGLWTYDQIMASFAPFSKEKPNSFYFKKLTHNFAKTGIRPELGLFDDWTVYIESFKNFAKASKDLGFKGIIFDNEMKKYWNYSDPFYVGHSLQECHDQARLRGRQLMEAAISVYPDITILVFHGPYTSATAAKQRGISCNNNTFLGSFAAGIIEGSALQKTSPHSTAIDGGELYDFRDLKEFQDSYKWRKTTVTDPAVTPKVLFMDDNLRKLWPKYCSIGFGIYTYERPDVTKGGWKPITDFATARKTAANALMVADDYVWLYSPNYDWFNDPKSTQTVTGSGYLPPVTKEWIEAIKGARLDAKIDTAPSN